MSLGSKNIRIFTLKEISDWQLSSPECLEKPFIQIPSLQRGLVWNAAQAEVLWDSLMRGIPIGTFSLISAKEIKNQKKSKSHLPEDWDFSNTFWLLDGQQRSNTIAMAYRCPFPAENLEESMPILWLDLKPNKIKSNRKFSFRVTTSAHPWGYRISDVDRENKNTKLYAFEIKEFCNKINTDLKINLTGDLGNIQKPKVHQLWPSRAELPIPFYILIELFYQKSEFTVKDIDDFVTSSDALKKSNWWKKFSKRFKSEELNKILNSLLPAFETLEQTRVAGLIAPRELAKKSSEDNHDDDTEIATYFLRMNKAGTVPSDEDVNYSILKSVAPELSDIDELAKGKMSAARLANLGMLAYRSKKKGEWLASINRKQVYELASNAEFKNYVISDVKTALHKINIWMEEGGLLPIHQTYLAQRRNGKVFLLLLLLALKGVEDKLTSKNICALATLISWFGENSCKYIYENFVGNESLDSLKKGIYHSIQYEVLTIPPHLKDFEIPYELGDSKECLDKILSFINDPQRSGAIEKVRHWKSKEGRELLLFACRDFMQNVFENYDPAQVANSEENIPWDYDHIFPKGWLKASYRGDWFSIVEKYIHSIGNIAPLPFQLNRGKGAKAPGNYCDNYREKLLITTYDSNKDFYKEEHGDSLERNCDKALRFVTITAKRFSAIYSKWYQGLQIATLLEFDHIEDLRKKLFEEIQAQLIHENDLFKEDDIKICYNADNSFQCEFRCHADWARPWLSIGIVRDSPNRDFVCISSNGDVIEIGRRRHPQENSIDNNTKRWWHDNYHTNHKFSEKTKKLAGEIIKDLKEICLKTDSITL